MNKKEAPGIYETFIAKSRYARYIDADKRRENWGETVSRYFDFVTKHLQTEQNYTISDELRKELQDAVTNFEVMPSMRALMTAGKALGRDSTGGYNCSYLPVDDPKCFDEAMFILLCGTGVGFSVERQYVIKLPDVPEHIYDSESTIVVSDSKEGWAKAVRQVIAMLYSGEAPKWDVSKVRPAGARLKVFGGRASGPAPLVDLFKFLVKLFKNAQGRKLNSIECHDIMCKIGEVVVVGGVRRCLPEGYLVKTNNGFVKIEDLVPGTDFADIGDDLYRIIEKAETGTQSVYDIVTDTGNQTSTMNHEWLVYDHDNEAIGWMTTEIIDGMVKNGANLSLVEQDK